MTTPFSLLCQVCGLSHREVAALLNVRLDTIRSWSSGRNPTPEGVLAELAGLADRIDAAADEGVDEIAKRIASLKKEHGAPEVIELGLASDDHEAQGLGWPCVGAQRAVLALTVARGMAEGYRFEIVHRGATSTTAAAADIHETVLR